MCPFRHDSLFPDPLGGNPTLRTRIWYSQRPILNFFECAPFYTTFFYRTLWGEIGRPLLEFGVRKVQFSLFVNVPLPT